MTDVDVRYYQRRVEQERTAAEGAERAEVRKIHRDLADRYAAIIQSTDRTPQRDRQRIAESLAPVLAAGGASL